MRTETEFNSGAIRSTGKVHDLTGKQHEAFSFPALRFRPRPQKGGETPTAGLQISLGEFVFFK